MQFKIILILASFALSAAQETTEADPCQALEEAMDACVTKNKCDTKCPDIFDDDDTDPDDDAFPTPDPTAPDMDAFAAQIQTFFSGVCDASKQEICKAKECCPDCGSELDAAVECELAAGKEIITGVLTGLQDTFGDLLGNATLPALNFDCDLKDNNCATTGSSNTDSSGRTSTNVKLLFAVTAVVAGTIF